jgi:DNA polymerase III gamma/tau subunit
MIFNFFKKDKRSERKKLIDEIDAAYIAKGGKKISDEDNQKAKERLHQVYLDGEEFEARLMKELAEEIRKEVLIKNSLEQGFKISDQMTLDALKSKYEAVLKDNGGQRNEDIETLIKDLGKK